MNPMITLGSVSRSPRFGAVLELKGPLPLEERKALAEELRNSAIQLEKQLESTLSVTVGDEPAEQKVYVINQPESPLVAAISSKLQESMMTLLENYMKGQGRDIDLEINSDTALARVTSEPGFKAEQEKSPLIQTLKQTMAGLIQGKTN